MDSGFGVDASNAFFHDGYFRCADIAAECRKLAIDIGDANFIEIDEGEFADAGAGEGFGCPRAYPADSNDAYVSGAQALKAARGIKPGNATEACRVIAH